MQEELKRRQEEEERLRLEEEAKIKAAEEAERQRQEKVFDNCMVERLLSRVGNSHDLKKNKF